MRTSSLLCVICIVFQLLLFLESEAFTRVSVPTALMIISTAAKIKAMWIKSYLGLRAMGYFRNYRAPQAVSGPPLHHYPRYKRSLTSGSGSAELFIDDQLLSAWRALELASGRQKLIFNERSCAAGAGRSQGDAPISSWRNILRSEHVQRLNNVEYSSFVSSLIGSLTRDPAACEFVKLATSTNSVR